jgi:putative transposase
VTRYALRPTPDQESVLLDYCAHARYVWNLAVEQQSWWKVTRTSKPASLYSQLAEVRAEHDWLRAGPSVVQQQALRDFEQAMRNFFAGTHGKPSWRRKHLHEGFRIVNVKPGHIRRLNRRNGEVFVPRLGWVRFRWSRAVGEAKSYRVKRDRAGRWFVAFATIPEPVRGPGTGEVVGIDRGVAATLAMSDGTMLQAPGPAATQHLARKLSRAKRGSNRRGHRRLALAKAKARNADVKRRGLSCASIDIPQPRLAGLTFGSLRSMRVGLRLGQIDAG